MAPTVSHGNLTRYKLFSMCLAASRLFVTSLLAVRAFQFYVLSAHGRSMFHVLYAYNETIVQSDNDGECGDGGGVE